MLIECVDIPMKEQSAGQNSSPFCRTFLMKYLWKVITTNVIVRETTAVHDLIPLRCAANETRPTACSKICPMKLVHCLGALPKPLAASGLPCSRGGASGDSANAARASVGQGWFAGWPRLAGCVPPSPALSARGTPAGVARPPVGVSSASLVAVPAATAAASSVAAVAAGSPDTPLHSPPLPSALLCASTSLRASPVPSFCPIIFSPVL